MKRRKQYKLSLQILVPIIVAGMAVLAFVLAYQLGRAAKGPSFFILSASFVAVGGLSGVVSFVTLRLFIRPMEELIKASEKMKNVAIEIPADAAAGKDEIDRFKDAVQQVNAALNMEQADKLFPEIIGRSHSMRSTLREASMVAPADTTVLIRGESGTGKELLAEAVHRLSPRAEGPFVKINCAAIPGNLLESELFGHEKGAFTGATARKTGKFEAASGGTILLDEIGDMPLDTQVKILRVLQEREFERVGGNKPVRVDVRVMAATNRDIARMVREGAFREDLYHRIHVFDLNLPPLRERREDIPLLVRTFRPAYGSKPPDVTPAAMKYLLAHDWPGNVRELHNVVERAALLAEGGPIDTRHLPPELFKKTAGTAPADPTEGTLDQKLADIEKTLIMEALRATGGVQSRAAERLGINQRSLWHRVKKYGIDVSVARKT